MAKVSLALSPLARRRSVQVLLGLAALLAVDCVYQIGMHITWRVWISRQAHALQTLASPSTQPAKNAKGAPPAEIAADLHKRNIFTPPSPKGHGMALTGVIGNLAIFSSRGGPVAIKEGESGGGIRVKSIDGYDVVIEYQGKPETLHLFSDQGGAPSMPPGGNVVMSAPGQPIPPGGAPVQMHMEAPAGSPDLSNLPPEIRARMESQKRRRSR